MAGTAAEKTKLGCGGWLVLLFIIGLIMSALGIGDDDTETSSSDKPTAEVSGASDESDGEVDQQVKESEAYEACKDWVNDQLKAPGTASYPDYWDFDGEVSIAPSSASAWIISSHVDAENTFGGEVRVRWVCDINLSGDVFRGNATLLE